MAISSNYIIVDRAISLTLELIMLPIFVFYAWDCLKFTRKMFKKKKKALSSRDILTKSSSKYRKAVHVFSLLTLLIYSSQGCNYVLNAFSLYPKSFSCDVIKKFSVLSYHLGKCCLYIALIFRVKIVFCGSTFHNNIFVRNALYAIYFLTFAFFIVVVFGDIFTITGTLVFATDDKKMYYCMLDDMQTWGFIFFIILDSVISILCVVLFNYPLKIVLRQHSNPKIVDLIRKYAVLSTTAICSTFFSILFVKILGLGWLSLLDNIINSVCLLFMSSWYSTYYSVLYNKICCCCHKRNESKENAPSSEEYVDRMPEVTNTNFSSTALPQTPRPAMSPSPKSAANGTDGTVMTFPDIENKDAMIVYKETEMHLQPMSLEKVQSMSDSAEHVQMGDPDGDENIVYK